MSVLKLSPDTKLSSMKGVSKYHAIRTTLNGTTYASKAEADVGAILELALQRGAIKSLTHQPKYELIPKPNKITYIADFLVTFNDGHSEIWDVKGMETAVFKLKHKLFKHFYPKETLVLIKKSKQALALL